MTKLSLRQRLALGLIGLIAAVGAGATWVMLPPRALGFAGGRSVTLAEYTGRTPTGVPPELRSADLVERGHYLTIAADCKVCHTAEGGKPYAGGRPFKTQFGTLYAPNITADQETGIGNWTDSEFIRAMHEGIGKDGSHLYPAFPYESYTLLADEDVRAIKAYLFSLPPVRAIAPANALAFPFNQRWLIALWSRFYNPDERFRPHEDRSPQWNRGAYIAEGLAHCGDCHTPRNLAQALDNRRKYGGMITAGWQAYNITSDKVSGVGAWADAQLLAYLRTGHATGHGSAAGPMAEAVDVSLSALAPADLNAVVLYLRSVPGVSTPGLAAPKLTQASDSPNGLEADVDPRGKQVFEGTCASCHGWSGTSLLTADATLTGSRAVNDVSAGNIVQIVMFGELRTTQHGLVSMPAFGHSYSDAEIAAVSNYVTARFGAEGSSITSEDVAQLRK